MTTRSRTIALVLTLLAGCEIDDIDHGEADDEDFPQRMAEAYCAALFACDPLATCWATGAPYQSEAKCVAAETQALVEVRDVAREHGLTFDAQCVETTITRYAEVGCEGAENFEIGERYLLIMCAPYYGTIPVGENPCFELVGSNLTECGQGLYCYEEGGSCETIDFDQCRCDEGLECSPYRDPDASCWPVLETGAVCEGQDAEPGVCGIDGYCQYHYDGMYLVGGNCEPREPLGSPCSDDWECRSYHCTGTCERAAPWLCSEQAAPRGWR